MKPTDYNYTNPEEWDENDDEMTFGHDEDQFIDDNEDNLTEDDTTDELAALQEKYNELNDSYLRLHAEFDNFRKRTIKEKADLIKSGGERVLLDIISLVDDFDRALVSLHEAEDKEAILEGMDLIYSKFILFLRQHGVKEVEAIGQPFDPDKFEAVATIPAQDESQQGMVIDCIQKGYEMHDKVIRFPKVIVGE